MSAFKITKHKLASKYSILAQVCLVKVIGRLCKYHKLILFN